MSPAVNVTLEEVPFAILEAVKARILGQRRRLDERKQRPSTRPRPQFRSVGASSKAWRPPQPAAGVIPGGVVVVHGVERNNLKTEEDSFDYYKLGISLTFPGNFNVYNFNANWAAKAPRDRWVRGKEFIISPPSGILPVTDSIEFPAIPAPTVGTVEFDVLEPALTPGVFVYTGMLSSATVLFTRNPQRTILLPTGEDSCILIITGRYALQRFTRTNIPVGEENNGYVISDNPNLTAQDLTYEDNVVIFPDFEDVLTDQVEYIFAYVCSNTAVRKISIPGTAERVMKDVLDDDSLVSSFPVNIGFEGTDINRQVRTWSPSVFKVINQSSAFISSELIKEAPSDPPIQTDTRFGYYAGSTQDSSLRYAEVRGSVLGELPEATVNYGARQQGGFLHAVWDWSDPDYCRRMCIALGFSPADLRP
jgi:hypothetical protein